MACEADFLVASTHAIHCMDKLTGPPTHYTYTGAARPWKFMP